MSQLDGLKPEKVFKYFEIISQIPRRSGNEKELSDYIVDFAKKRTFEFYQDDAYNVLVKKPGTKGYEHLPAVIIQGHLDMVCEKNKDSLHDFEKDGIEFVIEGDILKAKGTTLGADNGIAVAFGLALLDSTDIAHPPLEVIMTTDEEVGLTGAIKFDKSQLSGHYFINLDSEEEGELTVGCAGGCHAQINLPIVYDKEISSSSIVKNIMITNLKGGHSGVDIMNFRANANRLLGRLLTGVFDAVPVRIIDIRGGSKDNVITREAEVTLVYDAEDAEAFNQAYEQIKTVIINEQVTSEPQMKILDQVVDKIEDYRAFSLETTKKVIFLMTNLPNGVQTMSADLEGIPESSLNIGKVAIENDEVEFLFALRSNVRSLKYHLVNQLTWFSDMVGAKFLKTADYPEWAFKKDSQLLDIAKAVYSELFSQEPLVKAIHAGLEPGVFLETMKEIDAISFGPNMWDVHSPNESLSIVSTERTWQYLVKVLEALK